MDLLLILVAIISLGVFAYFLWGFAGLCDNVKDILKILKEKQESSQNKKV